MLAHHTNLADQSNDVMTCFLLSYYHTLPVDRHLLGSPAQVRILSIATEHAIVPERLRGQTRIHLLSCFLRVFH